MGDQKTANDEDIVTTVLRQTVSNFLCNNDDQDPTWNYLAAVQAHSDFYSGNLVIGDSQDITLPIDDVGVQLDYRVC